jgi:hypothetical protein
VYNVIAPTLEDSCVYNDSTGTGEPLFFTSFFIRAATDAPSVFFDSEADSGYSVDNLVPSVPSGFSAFYNTGSNNFLEWEESEDADFQYFNIYRSTDPEFEIAPELRVDSTIETSWTDPEYAGSWVTYKITAVDLNGNESEDTLPETTVDADLPLVPNAFILEQNVPNPFNPVTTIRYAVRLGGGHVSLQVFDVSGRLVCTLLKEYQTEGYKSIVWDGVNDRGLQVASGIYFYRMYAPGFSATRKMVLLR